MTTFVISGFVESFEYLSQKLFGDDIESAAANIPLYLGSWDYRELVSELLWYVPAGIVLYPLIARWIGAGTEEGDVRQTRLMTAGAITWFLFSWLVYWLLSHILFLGVLLGQWDLIALGVMAGDGDFRSATAGLLTAALSGVLFGAIYDLILHVWRR